MAVVCHHPPLPHKPGSNWIEKTKPSGLPGLIECVARAIYHTGRSQGDVSKAVRIAIGKVEDWAQGRGGVKPDTIAKAREAVSILRAKQAQAKANNLTVPVAEQVVDLATTPQPMRREGRERFPIRSHADVKKAVRAVGRARSKSGKASAQERAKVRRHIIRNAKRIGAAHLIPESWASDGSLNMTTIRESVDLSRFP